MLLTGVLIIPSQYINVQTLRAAPSTIHITGSAVSTAAELGQDVVVEPGATYTIHPPYRDQQDMPMYFNSLTIKDGGRVTHNPADEDGQMWVGIDNPINQAQYTEEWTGYFSPTGQSGNPAVDTLCFQVSAYIPTEPISIRFERIKSTGVNEVLSPITVDSKSEEMKGGDNLGRGYSITCYQNLKSSERYKLTTKVKSSQRFYDANDSASNFHSIRGENQYMNMGLHAFVMGVGKTMSATVNKCVSTGDEEGLYVVSCQNIDSSRGPKIQTTIKLDGNPSGYLSVKESMDHSEPGLFYTVSPIGAGKEYDMVKRYSFDTKVETNSIALKECLTLYCAFNTFGKTGLYGYTMQTTRQELRSLMRIPARMFIKVQNDLTVLGRGVISASLKGYPGATSYLNTNAYTHPDGYGKGGGVGIVSGSCTGHESFEGGGGSHAGRGRGLRADDAGMLVNGKKDAPAIYGNPQAPETIGSGGAGSLDTDWHVITCPSEYGDGGTGGGAIHIQAGAVHLSQGSQIEAIGGDPLHETQYTAGGGAGGSVYIETTLWDNPVTGSANVNAGLTKWNGTNEGIFGSPRTAEKGILTDVGSGVVNKSGTAVTTANMGSNVQAYGGRNAGGGYVTLHALAVPAAVGTISGYIFNDIDANGYKSTVMNYGEEPLITDGRAIKLTGTVKVSGAVYTVTVNTVDGRFVFKDVPAGTYRIEDPNVGSTSGWVRTAPKNGYYDGIVLDDTNTLISDKNFGYHEPSTTDWPPEIKITKPRPIGSGIPVFFATERVPIWVEVADDNGIASVDISIESDNLVNGRPAYEFLYPTITYSGVTKADTIKVIQALPAGSTYTITAVVKDEKGQTAKDQVQVKVRELSKGSILNYGIGSQSF